MNAPTPGQAAEPAAEESQDYKDGWADGMADALDASRCDERNDVLNDYERGYIASGIAQGEAASAQAPDQAATAADPFGGHEFAYESHTDLFRCIRCHRYQVTARKDDGTIEQCEGTAPDGSGPIEVNAW